MQREAKVSSFPVETPIRQQGSVEYKGSRALQEAAELTTTSLSSTGWSKGTFLSFAKEVTGKRIPAECWNKVTKYRGQVLN